MSSKPRMRRAAAWKSLMASMPPALAFGAISTPVVRTDWSMSQRCSLQRRTRLSTLALVKSDPPATRLSFLCLLDQMRGALHDRLGRVVDVGEKGIDLGTGDRLDFERGALGALEKGRIAQRFVECLAQRRGTVGGDAGRCREGARHEGIGEDHPQGL